MDKICGFYASDIHLVTMILPFIKEEIEKDTKIITFFEDSLVESINKIILNLITDDTNIEKILNINWKDTKLKKYSEMEKYLLEAINGKIENLVIISGNKKYIKETNNILDVFMQRNKCKNIKLINCFNVLETDDNIKEILDKHKYILNTSGIHKIEEMFEDYKKAN